MKLKLTFHKSETARTDDYRWYHNTSVTALMSILRSGLLGLIPFDGDWNSKPQPVRGWVSFTRSNKYRSAPGAGKSESDVRLVFDSRILKQRYKTLPYVDPFVEEYTDGPILKGYKSRWESEERVMGPINIRDGLIAIEVTQNTYDDWQAVVKRWRVDERREIKIRRAMSARGFFWNQVRKEFMKAETDAQKKMLKRPFKYKNPDVLYDYQALMDHPKLKVI